MPSSSIQGGHHWQLSKQTSVHTKACLLLHNIERQMHLSTSIDPQMLDRVGNFQLNDTIFDILIMIKCNQEILSIWTLSCNDSFVNIVHVCSLSVVLICNPIGCMFTEINKHVHRLVLTFVNEILKMKKMLFVIQLITFKK